MKACRRIVVVAVVVIQATLSVASTIPFEDGFESYANGTDLDGTNGWSVSEGAAWVQAVVANAGTRAAVVTNESTLSQSFSGNESNVWTSVSVRPTFSGVPTFPTNATVAFYVDNSGLVVAYDGSTETTLANDPIASNTWVEFLVHSDYEQEKWSLWLDDDRIATNLDFYASSVTHYTELGITQNSTNDVAYLDEVKVDTNATLFSLPFTETFETMSLGALDGQHGWLATDALVQGSVKYAGSQAASTTNSGTIQRMFTDGKTNVWTYMYMKPVFGSTNAIDNVPSDATVAFVVDTNGYVQACSGAGITNLNNAPITSNTWVWFTVESDYTQNKWSLWMGRTKIGDQLDFRNTSVSGYTEFGIIGGEGQDYVDDIKIRLSSPFTGSVFSFR